jgi:autophagy-related protein 2
MASLLPSTIQKRLLRYVLSRLELLDTDALDLEHLEISWGTKSVLEFKNVGLRLKVRDSLYSLVFDEKAVRPQCD